MSRRHAQQIDAVLVHAMKLTRTHAVHVAYGTGGKALDYGFDRRYVLRVPGRAYVRKLPGNSWKEVPAVATAHEEQAKPMSTLAACAIRAALATCESSTAADTGTSP